MISKRNMMFPAPCDSTVFHDGRKLFNGEISGLRFAPLEMTGVMWFHYIS